MRELFASSEVYRPFPPVADPDQAFGRQSRISRTP